MKRFIFIMPFLVTIACVTTPVTNRKAFIIIPESTMNALGADAYEETLKKEKISKDKKMTATVVRIGERIARASGVNYDWKFNLIESADTVNAFCLPGGKVAVYTGILPVAKNEAGLAAIMGHEVAHAVLKHSAERISQTLAVQTGVVAASLSFKDSKNQGWIAAALGLGATFGVILPYSRKHESEADMVGTEYMAKAGYDPREAVELWKRMAKLNKSNMPEFISTHPDSDRRSRNLAKSMSKFMKMYNASNKQPSKKL